MEGKRKNILILTADAGFGHRSAALAIKFAIEEQSPENYDVQLINPLDDKKAPLFLRESQSEYDKWVHNVPELYKFGYDISDAPIPTTILDTILLVSLFEVMNEILDEYKPDIVITTYPLYQASLNAVRSIRKLNFPIITIVTDISTVHQIWFHEKIDLLVVPTEIVKEDAIQAGLEPEKIYVIGIPVNPMIFLLRESKHELRQKLGWNETLTTILAVGSKRVEHFKESLNILNHSGFEFQIIVVTGKDKALYEELRLVEWHHPVQLYDFVDQMPVFMRASDLLVSKAGGLIVAESLASGLPMILIDAIPGQESGNAKFVQESKTGIWVKDSIEFYETLSHLLMDNLSELQTMQQNASDKGKPTSAIDIAKLILEQIDSFSIKHPEKSEFVQKLEKQLKTHHINLKKRINY